MNTRFCDLLGLRIPILQAPTASIATVGCCAGNVYLADQWVGRCRCDSQVLRLYCRLGGNPPCMMTERG